MHARCHVSVVVPLLNEAESLGELHTRIQCVCTEHALSYEIIFVDDGSTDDSWQHILALHSQDNRVRAIRFHRNYGKSAALNEAFQNTRGQVVITMDADLQDCPEEIPALYDKVAKEGYDLVSGWKKKRHDNVLTKNIPSKIFNIVTRKITGIPLHDFNCGLKAYRGDVVKHLEIFGEMHRYIPYLAKREGYPHITEIVVEHKARKYGKSKFGWDRFVNGFLDLLTIQFLTHFGKRPMHFFGLIGVLFCLIGGGIFVDLIVEKIVFMQYEMTKRPLFYGGILSCTIGMQLFLAGFIAEIVVRNAQDKNKYHVSARIPPSSADSPDSRSTSAS